MELRWVHSRPDMAFTSPNHSASALGKRGEVKHLTFIHCCGERRPGMLCHTSDALVCEHLIVRSVQYIFA